MKDKTRMCEDLNLNLNIQVAETAAQIFEYYYNVVADLRLYRKQSFV